MDWMKVPKESLGFLKKYRYVILVVAFGLVLMSLPQRKQTGQVPEPTEAAAPDAQDPAARLSEILSGVEGAGKVQVMLTQAKGAETLYQNDLDSDTGEQTVSNRQDTVVVTDENRAQQGLVRQVNPPVYQGAIVLCQGADKPSVRLAIVQAVSSVTGLGADHICVLKMK